MASGEAYYRDNYPNYERQNPPRKLEFYLRLVRQWVPARGHVHEVGVGLGAFIARAAEEYTCSGSDVNRFGVERTAARAPGVTVLEGSVEQMPTRPPPDAVVAWDVLEHLPDLESGLTCIRQRLDSTGVLIAVVPVYDGPLGWLVRRLDRDPTHVSKWSRGQWLTTLGDCGFEVVATGGVLRRLVFGRWYLHLTQPAALWRWAGSAFWFVARVRGAQPAGDARSQP